MPRTAEQRAAKNARRKQRREDPEVRARENAWYRSYYQAHKDKICERNRTHYHVRQYGISAAEYDALLKKQNGACAICRRRSKERLCVDHCHLTGMMRGLLWRRCNLALGILKDDQGSLIAAVASACLCVIGPVPQRNARCGCAPRSRADRGKRRS